MTRFFSIAISSFLALSSLLRRIISPINSVLLLFPYVSDRATAIIASVKR